MSTAVNHIIYLLTSLKNESLQTVEISLISLVNHMILLVSHELATPLPSSGHMRVLQNIIFPGERVTTTVIMVHSM